MRMVTVRMRNASQELLRERAEIALAIVGSSDAGRSRVLD
jgi:hypothetical protein